MTTENQAFDAIIHIGAGRGRELASHLEAGARRIVLIDADSAAIAGLRRLAAGAAHAQTTVEIVQAAVAGGERDAELRIYNLERVSGIREPEALTQLYPGLRLVRSSNCRTRAASEVIDEARVDPRRENKLVIDAPGEELPILQDLERAGALAGFSHIAIVMARRPAYKGSAGAGDVTAALRAAGYIVQTEGEGEWLTLKAFRARALSDMLEIERLEKELAARAAERTALADAAKKRAEEVEKLKRRIAELEEKPDDAVDRTSVFATELGRCEMQIDLLKELLLNGREG